MVRLTGRNRTPFGHELEEQHDDDERQDQPVFAQVLLEGGLRGSLGRIDRGCGGFGAHDAAFSSPRTIARMIFSCDASWPAISPTMRPSFMHVDAVADAEQFRHLRRDDDDAFAFLRELVDDGVDLVFRADIDAARRLVEDQHFRIGEQPLRQHDLLLVAAGKVAGRSGRRWTSGCWSSCGSRWRPSARPCRR